MAITDIQRSTLKGMLVLLGTQWDEAEKEVRAAFDRAEGHQASFDMSDQASIRRYYGVFMVEVERCLAKRMAETSKFCEAYVEGEEALTDITEEYPTGTKAPDHVVARAVEANAKCMRLYDRVLQDLLVTEMLAQTVARTPIGPAYASGEDFFDA